jgi:hypothetical protein
MAVIDVHTHAFPDAIVERAMQRLLSEAPGVEAFLDGRLSSLLASILGAWQDWDEVAARLLGRPVYMEVSWSFECLGVDKSRDLLRRHPPEYVLFGSDSPWRDQAESLSALRSMGMGRAWERLVLEENPARLLGLA